ncbi:MAG: hypothetical protein IPM24_21800 [Bryobacterales bacterium]|nr:hypothetical protein [Bryobacterales bacterium]
MRRAAVLIGVDKTGNLPLLRDAARGARRMEVWARSQGMDPVIALTDEGGPVEIGAVKRAIREIVDLGTVEQLIVYFAGHGVNIRYGEYWLLTDAPRDTQAAVDVRNSEVLARYCGIPHVVFFSDACRTAAAGIQAQFVTGSEIFPNDGAGDLEKPVDQFFACTLGRPAHEVPDPQVTASEFTALYTQELLKAFRGQPPSVVDWRAPDEGFLRPRPLKDHLTAAVAARIRTLNLQTRVIQVPDARITSGPDAWVSKVAQAPAPPPPMPVAPPSPAPPPPTPARLSASLVHSALETNWPAMRATLSMARATELAPIAAAVERAEEPFGPLHYESQCGFKIRGSRIVQAVSQTADTELFETPGEFLRVNGMQHPGAGVLLVLENGGGVHLPAIPGWITALTVDEGELVDVAYEPSDNTALWSTFAPHAETLRTVRAVASSATRGGVFHLEGEDAEAALGRIRFDGHFDPSLALYTAYAYDALHRRAVIRDLSGALRGELGGTPFDIALLAGELDRSGPRASPSLFGGMPLLVQGWSQLRARRVSLPDSLAGIERELIPSPWTLFNPAGADRVRQAMLQGDLR